MNSLNDFLKIGTPIEHKHEFIRIDAYLGRKFPFLSRVKWKKRIQSGEIKISPREAEIPQSRVKPTYTLQKYDQIWYYKDSVKDEFIPVNIDIIYDDGDICIFSKPANMVVHPVGVYSKNNFLNHIAHMGYKDCYPVHRIDRETSGILVCARQSKTRAAISQLFRENKIKKLYYAITKGTTELPDEFNVSSPIGSAENSQIRLKLWVNTPDAIPAMTEFKKISNIGEHSLFACMPKTGRTNQIRIHLASIGQWIVGDKMYHSDEKVFLEFYEKGYTDWVHENVLFPRHLLHNAGILIPGFIDEFVHCPIPQDILEYSITSELLEKSNIKVS